MQTSDGKQTEGRRSRERSDVEAGNATAWELIEAGRYMPRRIKGSYPGRELG